MAERRIRRFERLPIVSPPASVGTTSTGLTGDQGTALDREVAASRRTFG